MTERELKRQVLTMRRQGFSDEEIQAAYGKENAKPRSPEERRREAYTNFQRKTEKTFGGRVVVGDDFDPKGKASVTVKGADGREYASARDFNLARGVGVPSKVRDRAILTKRYGLASDASYSDILKAATTKRDSLGSYKETKNFSQLADEMWRNDRHQGNLSEIDRRKELMERSGQTVDNANHVDISDMTGFGGVKFSGPGGMPFTMPKNLGGAWSVKALAEARRRAGIEGAAYKALQEQQYQQRQKDLADRSNYIFYNYDAIKDRELDEALKHEDNLALRQAKQDVLYVTRQQRLEQEQKERDAVVAAGKGMAQVSPDQKRLDEEKEASKKAAGGI